MKRLAALAVAFVLMEVTLSAQPPSRVYSRPTVPTTDALNRLNLKLGWKAALPMDGQKDGILSTQVVGENVYVQLKSGAVIALNGETGQKLWHARYAAPYKNGFPLGFNYNTVFQVSGTHVYAIDRAGGEIAWVWDLAASPSAGPVADAEKLYICTIGNKLKVFDLMPFAAREGPAPGTAAYAKAKKDEEVRKETASEGTPQSRAGYASQSKVGARGMASAFVQGPYHGVGIAGGLNNWELPLLWSYTGDGRIDQAPVLTPRNPDHPGYVLLTGSDGSVAISSKVERQISGRKELGSAISAPLNQFGDTAYIPTESGTLLAMSIEFNRPVWQVGLGGAIKDRPAVTDEDVFVVSTRGGLRRIDRMKGEILWKNDKAVKFLAENKKLVFALDKIGNLLILDRARGTQIGSLDTHDFTEAVQNDYTDRVYLAANDGMIFCVRDRENTKPLWNKKYQEDKPVLKKTPEDKEREAMQKEKEKEKGEKKEMEKKDDKKDDKKD
jgi:outer membrane protein assembly factor BamB